MASSEGTELWIFFGCSLIGFVCTLANFMLMIQCHLGFSQYKKTWWDCYLTGPIVKWLCRAQTIIDILVKHAYDNALKFTSVQRNAIENLWTSVREQQMRRKQGKSSSSKLDVTSFERLQHQYSRETISIRRAVGSSGERSAEQWLGWSSATDVQWLVKQDHLHHQCSNIGHLIPLLTKPEFALESFKMLLQTVVKLKWTALNSPLSTCFQIPSRFFILILFLPCILGDNHEICGKNTFMLNGKNWWMKCVVGVSGLCTLCTLITFVFLQGWKFS